MRACVCVCVCVCLHWCECVRVIKVILKGRQFVLLRSLPSAPPQGVVALGQRGPVQHHLELRNQLQPPQSPLLFDVEGARPKGIDDERARSLSFRLSVCGEIGLNWHPRVVPMHESCPVVVTHTHTHTQTHTHTHTHTRICKQNNIFPEKRKQKEKKKMSG